MGGKRPDQYQIDPGEAGSTDYKFLEPDEGIKTAEKHELASNVKADEADHGLIPVTHQNPVAAMLRERKGRGGRENQKGNGKGKAAVGKATKSTSPSSRGKGTKAGSSKHSGQAKARTAKSKGKRSNRGG
ncbi:MAG: hypothetical protein ABR543_08470 [Gemmatimonadaceae bacterium]